MGDSTRGAVFEFGDEDEAWTADTILAISDETFDSATIDEDLARDPSLRPVLDAAALARQTAALAAIAGNRGFRNIVAAALPRAAPAASAARASDGDGDGSDADADADVDANAGATKALGARGSDGGVDGDDGDGGMDGDDGDDADADADGGALYEFEHHRVHTPARRALEGGCAVRVPWALVGAPGGTDPLAALPQALHARITDTRPGSVVDEIEAALCARTPGGQTTGALLCSELARGGAAYVACARARAPHACHYYLHALNSSDLYVLNFVRRAPATAAATTDDAPLEPAERITWLSYHYVHIVPRSAPMSMPPAAATSTSTSTSTSTLMSLKRHREDAPGVVVGSPDVDFA